MNDEMAAAHLAQILHGWIDSVTEPELACRLRDEAYIAGGAIASLLLDEQVQDYDVYVREEATAQAVKAYYEEFFRRYPAPPFDPRHPFTAAADLSEPCRPLAMTANAVYLSYRIQLMTVFYGEPAWMVSNYDFHHCSGYYTAREGRLVVLEEARQAIAARSLHYRPGRTFPMLSVLRLPKFIARGYTIDLAQLFQLVAEVAAGGLGDHEKIRQLLGLLSEKESRFTRGLAATESLPEGPVDNVALGAIQNAILAP
jgi:hypothetical protein